MSIIENEYAIGKVFSREILDGTGQPTVEVDVWTESGRMGRASVPSGSSKSEYEAVELRDGGNRYCGRGVRKAVENVNTIISPRIKGLDVRDQKAIDRVMIELDGSSNKSTLGGNAILAVSTAVAQAGALSKDLPLYRCLGGPNWNILPVPVPTVVAGGKYAGNNLDFEDFLLIPKGFESFASATQAIAEVYDEIGRILRNRYGVVPLAQTAFAPTTNSNEEVFETILEATEKRGYGNRFALGLDVAAGNFFDAESKKYRFGGKTLLTEEELVGVYENLIKDYPIELLEDPFHEDAFGAFAELTRQLDISIVGDDLFATDKHRLQKGISLGAANTLLLKINQIGTISEALETVQVARENGYGIIASARSRECNDDWLADIAIGTGATHIKLGAPSRGERNVKYNRLLRIEEELGPSAALANNDIAHR